MAATKTQAALRAAKKLLGKVPPRTGVSWRQLIAEVTRQAAVLRKREDLSWSLTLNEAAGALGMQPNRLRRLVDKYPLDLPLFTRPDAKPRAGSRPASKATRKPNTVSRASMVRLVDWHEGLVAAGHVEPITERVDLDARVGGDGVPRVRVQPWVLPRAAFKYKDEGDGKFRILGVRDAEDFGGLLKSLGGQQIGFMVMTFPEALKLPWEDAAVRNVWAQAFTEWLLAAEADVALLLAELRAAKLDMSWAEPAGEVRGSREPPATKLSRRL
ncbi:hypothetical protein [Lysobacter capsici]|uniref:hypothetical protein n=1 Tax=Lysobacter capsici TaxID=435897 RepID=UPI001BFFDCCB|nr:hypothetical protein [Lysobacter capsici]QWF18161.1 hypothetical protein KME82_05175 [Lysobacter capsici]